VGAVDQFRWQSSALEAIAKRVGEVVDKLRRQSWQLDAALMEQTSTRTSMGRAGDLSAFA
jgi:Na+/H+-translocating membrane pyrophosphatase